MLYFKSIISRIIFLHVIAIGITSIFMPLALYWLLNTATDSLHDRAMRQQAETFSRYLSVRADGSLSLSLPPALQDLYSEDYGRYAYAVIDQDGHILFSSFKNNSSIFPSATPSASVAYLQTTLGDKTMSGVSVPDSFAGRTIWIQIAENLTHGDVLTDDLVGEFFKRVGWITVPILLLLLAIDIVIFRRALGPLMQASEQARAISPRRTDIRLPTSQIPTELQPLVLAVNQALDRLEEGFRAQGDFAADAAHELRTPLSILRTRIETLPDQDTVKILQRDIERMSRIVTQLLDIAELDTFVVDPDDRADLAGVSLEIAELLAPLAIAQGKDMAVSGATHPVWIKGNSEMLGRAIRNLAENAINHTAPGTTVEFIVDKDGKLSVLDRGPGIPSVEHELIFKRFWRRDRRRIAGAGLGLAIVRRFVEAHDATISVGNREGGGAKFTLSLVTDDMTVSQQA